MRSFAPSLATRTTPTIADVEAARERIAPYIRTTPVYESDSLTRACGRTVRLKAENLQRTGSFKIRGAVNTLSTLSQEERAAGVIAASAGNHGQAVARAARDLGIDATIFMPQDAPMAKVEPTISYGGQAVLVGNVLEDAFVEAQRRAEETGGVFVHAYEDERVIAGQGTLGVELAEQVPDCDTVLIPIGGGGLASGIAIAMRALRPEVRLIGIEARREGYTIADGIAVKQPGALTSSILDELLDDVVRVTDEEISEAITLLLERSKLVVEGAGAVGVAALLTGKVPGDGPVCALLSGGNIDPTLLISVMRHGLTAAGRYLVIRSRLPDRPGELIKLLDLIARERGNLVSVEHHREGVSLDLGDTGVELTIVTRNEEHCRRILQSMEAHGFPVERIR
ncbi:MAG: threonine ammonia-lyase [Actinobacteria bacterium]|nr:threonine ammonia-lyase [Actinomycetota bacterium]MBV8598587.1 threonine ammonia-lyase [Actinomycetota bacterium]